MELRESKRIKLNKQKVLSYKLQNLFHSIKPSITNKIKLIHSCPNIYIIDNFLTSTQINYFNHIITLSNDKFKVSYTEDSNYNPLLSDDRTSTYLHINKSSDRIIRSIESKCAEIIGLSTVNIEPMQIVSYTNSQKFDIHHDIGEWNFDTNEIIIQYPKRLVTYFVYLNTLPYGQGETEFPFLKLKIKPESGKALMFCNVLSDGSPDHRVVHQACAVEGIVKFYLVLVVVSL